MDIYIHIFFLFKKYLLFVLVFCILNVSQTYAEFEIIEVMPNTVDDKSLEYITIQNTSSETLSLSGYILSDKKKDFLFDSEFILEGGEERQFFRPETKLVLNNSNEKLTLKNSTGEIVSEVEYASSVKSVSLIFENNEAGTPSAHTDTEVNIQNNSQIGNESSENNSHEFQIQLGFQRPSYVFQSGGTNVYICDNSKEECKINFSLEKSFGGNFPQKDYYCSNNFGGYGSGETQKCNPNTIVFPEGEHQVVFQIFRKNDNVLIGKKEITILYDRSNKEYKNTSHNNITIMPPKIRVQSGLEGEGRYFYCKKKECKINLEYKKRHKDERCRWRFYPGIYESKTTRDRCNPGYVTFPEGIFELSLRVYQEGNTSNRKKQKFYIYNTDDTRNYLSKKQQEKFDIMKKMVRRKQEAKEEVGGIAKKISFEDEEKQLQEQLAIDANIVLQGKVGEEKTFSGGMLNCQGVEKCYLNFTASGFSDFQKYSYQWLNNGELFSEKYNPGGEWFELGKHTIEFKVFQNDKLLSSSTYVALVSKEELLVSATEKVSKPQIKKGEGTKKNFTQNYLPLKYDGFRISGKAPIGSKVEVFLGEKLLGNTGVNQKGKYRMVTKNIGAGSHKFSTKITFQDGEKKIYENSGEYTLLQEKRAFWFISKKSRKSSSPKSQTRTNFLPELVISAHADESYERAIQETYLTPSQKMLSYLLLAIALFGAILHMAFRQMEGIMRTSLVSLYNLRFSTKQRVNLLVG